MFHPDLAWKRRQNSGPERKVLRLGKTEVVTETLLRWSSHGGKHGRRMPAASLAEVWLPMSLKGSGERNEVLGSAQSFQRTTL